MKNKIYINGYSLSCALGENAEEIVQQLFADSPQMKVLQHDVLKMPYFTMSDYDNRGYVHAASAEICFSAVNKALNMTFPATGTPPAGLRIGCIVGTTGDVQFGDLDFYRSLQEDSPPDDKIIHFVHGTIAEWIVQKYGFTGPALTISNTCVSGADAALVASQWIEADLCDMVITLGIDLISLMCLSGFYTLSAASTEHCKPFDQNRSGMNVGEGCGCVILRKGNLSTELENSFSRPEFLFRGGGSACDAYHLTAPHPEGRGLQQAIKKAFSNSGVSATDIAFINAHGTGTPANDSSEAFAFKAVLGDQVPFFSTKGLTGHTLGASGTLELIFTMLCLKEQRIPKSFNCSEPDPEIALSPNMELKEIAGKIAMSTSLAFGGCNTALIVERV